LTSPDDDIRTVCTWQQLQHVLRQRKNQHIINTSATLYTLQRFSGAYDATYDNSNSFGRHDSTKCNLYMSRTPQTTLQTDYNEIKNLRQFACDNYSMRYDSNITTLQRHLKFTECTPVVYNAAVLQKHSQKT